MITALLKHEALRTRSMLSIIAGGGAAIVLVSSAVTTLQWPVLSGLGVALGILVLVALVPVLQVALTIDYWRTSYRQLGYFTQSIPVKGSTIFWAKMLWTWLVTLGAIVLTGLLAAVFWPAMATLFPGVESNLFALVGTGFEFVQQYASTGMIVTLALLVVVNIFIWPAQYFFCVSLGSESPMNRLGVGGPILMFVAFYTVMQLLTAVGIFALPFGLGVEQGQLGIVQQSVSFIDALGSSDTEAMPVGFIPVLFLITAVALWRTHYSWNRKVSLV